MSEWKRYSAHTLGIEWQRGFFDHRLRKEESFVEKAHYIRMNPVRAGLVAKLEDWPHVWTMDGASRHGGINSALAPLCSGERALPSNPNAIASEQKGTTTNKGRDRSPSGPPT
ncbi:MAG: hypothetical protein HYV35_12495 [Lentisphaerae bacterium]|nr:hypothetical protein [Lentisphaerota bacterium]